MEPEVWQRIPSLGGKYIASNLGNIMGPSGRVLKFKRHVHGYLIFGVSDGNGRTRNVYVARCVCEAFHGQPPPGAQVDHINHERDDNRPENLRWVSKSENLAHRRPLRGSASPRAKLTEESVRAIRSGGRTDTEWASLLGVSRRHINDVRRGILWRHVDA